MSTLKELIDKAEETGYTVKKIDSDSIILKSGNLNIQIWTILSDLKFPELDIADLERVLKAQK